RAEYDPALDEKNRLALPAKFRESFAGGAVVTRGMDGCLYAYARAQWDELVERRLGTLDLLSRDDRVIQRYFFSAGAEVEPDKQGRIMVPARLIEHGKLGRDVVVAGGYDHHDNWDRAAWRAQLQTLEASP